MSYITNIRLFFKNFIDRIKGSINSLLAKIFHLRESNLSQAVDFIELGMTDEAFNRLRIILTLWPDEEQAKYLMGLLNIFARENEKALKYFNEIKNYKIPYIHKLIGIVEKNKYEKIIDVYKETFSLYEVENEIYKIKI